MFTLLSVIIVGRKGKFYKYTKISKFKINETFLYPCQKSLIAGDCLLQLLVWYTSFSMQRFWYNDLRSNVSDCVQWLRQFRLIYTNTLPK